MMVQLGRHKGSSCKGVVWGLSREVLGIAGACDDGAEPLPEAAHVHAHRAGQEPRHGCRVRRIQRRLRPAPHTLPAPLLPAAASVLDWCALHPCYANPPGCFPTVSPSQASAYHNLSPPVSSDIPLTQRYPWENLLMRHRCKMLRALFSSTWYKIGKRVHARCMW